MLWIVCVALCSEEDLLWEGWDLGSDLDRDGWRTEIRHEVADAQDLSRATAHARAEHMLIVLW